MRARSAFLVGVLFFCASCGSPTAPSGSIQYKVSGIGTTRASITYESRDGGTSQANGAMLPWSYDWTNVEPGAFVYVSAQNDNASGTVTVQIWRDGSLFKSATSSGAYGIATASGTY